MSVAAVVSGNFNLSAAFTQTQQTGVVGPNAGTNSQSLTELITIADQLLNNTGAAKTCDQMYASQLTLSAATTTVHFGNASAKDPFGNTITMARIRLLLVQNITATSGYDVKIEQAASDGIAWLPVAASTPPVARANFGLYINYDPNSNGASVGNYISSTTDGITFDPGSNNCTINVVVIGDSVA